MSMERGQRTRQQGNVGKELSVLSLSVLQTRLKNLTLTLGQIRDEYKLMLCFKCSNYTELQKIKHFSV